ncbi:EpsG family protein [Thalassobius sp. Cn5-15]|uniref:EpsG family protein n=1 Tax=Thalassobius sp. Cn5-15 TaxID=2917763 RepID=UPI001EF2A147|nr:EpsG family protein [Thalassobius sp. Cn5-15]MCG7495010.1 EpsG family protein [Thalassobius sp. Cn5-15]
MWTYWMLLAVPATAILLPIRLNENGRFIALFLFSLLLVLVIGLRHEVGGDWSTYLEHQLLIEKLPLAAAAAFGDPGYYVFSWISGRLGGGIYLTNTFCAIIFTLGVFCFSKSQPLPWVALFVAIPYLVIVVAMGYTRQSAAIGLALIGLTYLQRGQILKFVACIILGALFHKTAVVLLPIAGLTATKGRFWNALWVFAMLAIAGSQLLLGQLNSLWGLYVAGGMTSEGGNIRIFMNLIPATLYLLFYKAMRLELQVQRLWYWMALTSIACFCLVFLSSTLADRISLYFLPIQMFVFTHIYVILKSPLERAALLVAILGYYFLVQWVWLTMANHSSYWIPYQIIWN